MIDVRINKLKEKIALVLIESGQEVAVATFNYNQAKELINRILYQGGVFLGQINQKMTAQECDVVIERIMKAHNLINHHIIADVTVEPYLSKTYEKWVVKISNRVGQVRFLAAETVNGFLTELKLTKTLMYLDSTTAQLSDAQGAALTLKLFSARQKVVSNNASISASKPWLKETLLLDR
jgi:hypothetical protein